jgi:cytochrome c553
MAVAVAVLLSLSACATPDGSPNAVGDGAAVAEQVEGTIHVCASCHGIDGKSISPTFPRLAGQTAAYIEVQLHAFRDHTRADPHAHTYMWGMAAHLGDPADMAAGKTIFVDGIADRDVPACQACHGDHAEGMDTVPRLAGQHRGYLTEQLENFASKARDNEIMHENSKNLSADEIRQITAYLAAQ